MPKRPLAESKFNGDADSNRGWSAPTSYDVKGRQIAAAVERSTTVTLMYAAHCSLDAATVSAMTQSVFDSAKNV